MFVSFPRRTPYTQVLLEGAEGGIVKAKRCLKSVNSRVKIKENLDFYKENCKQNLKYILALRRGYIVASLFTRYDPTSTYLFISPRNVS